jgi:hypothetical protein
MGDYLPANTSLGPHGILIIKLDLISGRWVLHEHHHRLDCKATRRISMEYQSFISYYLGMVRDRGYACLKSISTLGWKYTPQLNKESWGSTGSFSPPSLWGSVAKKLLHPLRAASRFGYSASHASGERPELLGLSGTKTGLK